MYAGCHKVWEYPPGLMVERIKASMSPGVITAEPHLVALGDPVHDRVNLILANGVVLRVAWPLDFGSPLVCASISALAYVLPPAVLFAFRGAVLSSEDSSAADLDPEWSAFVAVLEHAVEGAVQGLVQSRAPEQIGSLSSSCQESAKKSKSDGCKKLKHDMGDVAHPADGDAAWLRLLQSDLHTKMKSLPCLSSLEDPAVLQPDNGATSHAAPVMPPLDLAHLPQIILALHMTYEDFKVCSNRAHLGAALAGLLTKLSSMTGSSAFLDFYLRDHPALACQNASFFDDMPQNPVGSPQCAPPDIYRWLENQLGKKPSGSKYCPEGLARSEHGVHAPWTLSLKIVRLYRLLTGEADEDVSSLPHQQSSIQSLVDPDGLHVAAPLLHPIPPVSSDSGTDFQLGENSSPSAVVMKAMLEEGVTMDDLIQMPAGVALPLWCALLHCRDSPASSWSTEAFYLIGRNDLATQQKMTVDQTSVLFQHVPSFDNHSREIDESSVSNQDQSHDNNKDADGLGMFENYAALRFGQDRRAKEVRRMLCSSKLMCLRVPRAPETSDHDYLAQQHVALLLRAQRAMALPVGRGMVTISSIYALPTEGLPIPKLVLSGRVPPTNASISLDAANTPTDLTNWPSFHNGVAAGLQLVSSDVACVTRNWIVYNRPESPTFEHAGVLMALGLQGHLSQLAVTDIFRYLSYRHSATTVGVLLGMAAAKRGTMDPNVSKLLVMHIPYLLPPSLPEMEVASVVQMAAVMGVGLLYQGTCHRLMTEVLLTEIGRRPMSDSTLEREGYSLAAGLALGLVTLGKGGKSSGFEDLHIEDKLQRYIDGGVDAMASSIQQPNNTARCCRIMESDMVNVDVTAPGATLALGLMFMKRNNAAVAARLAIPDTHFLLEHVRPDFVLLRVLAHSLVMWDAVQPTEEWLKSQVPVFLQKYHADPKSSSEELDHEALRQAHAYILAGGCFAIGLRYAGTSNASAHQLLLKHVKYFAAGCGTEPGSKEWTQRDRPALETCLNTAALGLGMVMAGTGDLEALKLLRAQRRRMDPEIMYGNHVALQTAIGFLFLGGGRFTLSRSNAAIASLVVALYPRFTVTTTSNRYYLQAFRHFYVLALEPRCLHSIDVDTNMPCFVPLVISTNGDDSDDEGSSTQTEMMTPCLIPDPNGVQMVEVVSPRYWYRQVPIRAGCAIPQVIYVKRKAGYLPYNVDPTGSKGLAADFSLQHTECSSGNLCGAGGLDGVVIKAFAAQLCRTANDTPSEKVNFLDGTPSYSTMHKNVQLLPVYMALHQLLQRLEKNQPIDPVLCWELRLLLAYHNRTIGDQSSPVSLDSAATVYANLDALFDGLNLDAAGGCLEHYLKTFSFPADQAQAHQFAGFLAYCGFPNTASLQHAKMEISKIFAGKDRVQPGALMPILALLLPETSAKALSKLSSIWSRGTI